MPREGLAVEPPGEKRVRRECLVARQAPAVLLIDVELLRSKFHLFLPAIGSEEDELSRLRLQSRAIEDRAQGYASPPAVAAEALKRSPIARTLEAENELGVAHAPKLIERQRQGSVDKPAHFQAECGGIDDGMSVMLSREEAIGRGERPVDGADIVLAVYRPWGGKGWRRVGERHQRLALREGGQRPVRDVEKGQTCDGEATPEHVAAALCGHAAVDITDAPTHAISKTRKHLLEKV